MDSFVTGQFILFVVVFVCFHQIQAEEPRCYYMDMERRLMEQFRALETQNEALLSRLKSIETKIENKEEFKRTGLPPYSYVLRVDELEYDNWTMVFRATAGNGYNVYDAWTEDKGTCDSKPVTMERSRSCHYRSKLVPAWSNLHIEQVKFALYSQYRELGYVILNGKDSDISSWFDKSRVISSSWSDVTSANTFNYFSTAGYFLAGAFDRRFHINRSYGGCDKDLGHVVVVDTKTVPSESCQWDNHVIYPQFLYSKINAADLWNGGHYGRAEYMAIFIKTQ